MDLEDKTQDICIYKFRKENQQVESYVTYLKLQKKQVDGVSSCSMVTITNMSCALKPFFLHDIKEKQTINSFSKKSMDIYQQYHWEELCLEGNQRP